MNAARFEATATVRAPPTTLVSAQASAQLLTRMTANTRTTNAQSFIHLIRVASILRVSDGFIWIALAVAPQDRFRRCRPEELRTLFARQHGSQKSEFGFHFCRIGHRIRDFLSKQFAISLAKPVDRYFERSL